MKRKYLRKILRLVRTLPKEDYNDEALACLLLRVYYGNKKTGKTLFEDPISDNLPNEIHERIDLFERTGEMRHLIDGVRYHFGELALLLEAGWEPKLPVCYKNFVREGKMYEYGGRHFAGNML